MNNFLGALPETPNNSKKVKVLTAVLLAVFMLFAMSLGACATKQSETAFDIEKLPSLMAEKGYLPENVAKSLTKYKSFDMGKGAPIYGWTDGVSEMNEASHRITASLKGAGLSYFEYENFSYDAPVPAIPLTEDEAAEMAIGFAGDFIDGGDQLSFAFLPDMPELFSLGHVESWVAYDADANRHTILVDRDMGGVVYYTRSADAYASLGKGTVVLPDFTILIPERLSIYDVTTFANDFTLHFSGKKDEYNGDASVGGMSVVAAAHMDEINHAELLSSEKIYGFADKAVKRIFLRDYPAASGITEAYEELHIAVIKDDLAYDFWGDLRYMTEGEITEMAKGLWKADLDGNHGPVYPSIITVQVGPGYSSGETTITVSFTYASRRSPDLTFANITRIGGDNLKKNGWGTNTLDANAEITDLEFSQAYIFLKKIDENEPATLDGVQITFKNGMTQELLFTEPLLLPAALKDGIAYVEPNAVYVNDAYKKYEEDLPSSTERIRDMVFEYHLWMEIVGHN